MSLAEPQTIPAVPVEAAPPQEMARRVGRNSAWLIARPLLLNVLSVFSNAYIARKLGADDYGLFNLGFAQVALFTPLCNLGIRAVAIRAIAQRRERAGEVIGAVVALRFLLTFVAALLAGAWLCLPAYSATTRWIGLAAIGSMVCNGLGFAATDLFQGFERSRLGAQPQLIGGLILTALSVAALLLGLGLPGFVGAYVLGAAIQLLLLEHAARTQLLPLRPRWDWAEIRSLILQARPFAFLSLLSNVTDVPVIDVLILGACFGSDSVGPYTAASGLVLRLLMVPSGVADALYPAVAGGVGLDREEVEQTVRRSVQNLLLLTLLLAVCLTFSARTALWVLFGNQYLSAANALRVLGWLLPLIGINYLARECLNAAHRQDRVVRISIGNLAVMAALYAALIPHFGITGAAIAGVAREAIMLGFWLAPLRQEFRKPIPFGGLGRVLAAALAMTCALAPALYSGSHLAMIGAVALGFVLYAAMAWRLGLIDLDRLRRG
jgi:O-antigen/teichoic acid export membrane protein